MHSFNNIKPNSHARQIHATNCCLTYPVGSVVKNPPTVWELQDMCVQSLCQEDPLEKGMTTHSNTLAWEIAWTEEIGRL